MVQIDDNQFLIKQTEVMNIQKLNLGLTLELMNQRTDNVSLNTFKRFMGNVKEAGKFLGTKLKEDKDLGNKWSNQSYTLNYENCSLNVEMMSSAGTESRVVKGFKFN